MVEHGYIDRLHGFWRNKDYLLHNLQCIEKDATERKQCSIQHVQRIKRNLMARLHGIQCKIQLRQIHQGLLNLERKLQGDLKTILRQ